MDNKFALLSYLDIRFQNFRSVSKIGERPMHLESGFLKIKPETNELSLLVSHNFGICSIEEGKVDGTSIVLESTDIIRNRLSKDPHVTKLRRIYKLIDNNQLEIRTDMATTTVPELTNHLIVVYKKKV